jgi:negative regulator of flagellin synthesis FlgM
MSISNNIGTLQPAPSQVTAAPAPAGKEQQVKASTPPPQPAPKVVQLPDQANISSTSGLVSQALSGSDVRLDRIQPIQAAIASGTYSVSSSDVADKLINNLQS